MRALLPALGLLAVGSALLFAWSVRTAGAFVYPLDDAYLHMAVAREWLHSGTWGLTADEFASASSSPLWTVVLTTAFAAVGLLEKIPLVLNLVAAGLVLWAADRQLREDGLGSRERALTLVLVCLLVPLPAIALLGMEHLLHLAGVLLFVAATLAWSCNPVPRRLAPLAAIAFLLPLLRYESLFLTGWTGAFLLASRRVPAAMLVWGAPVAGVGAFGAWSVLNGGLPIPNALVMKSSLSGGLVANALKNVPEGWPVWLLVGGVAVVAVLAPRRPTRDMHAALFVLVAATHLVFAGVGWYYRYEAWLVGWGLVVLAGLPLARPASRLAGLVGVLVLLPRAWDAWRYMPGRVAYIHDMKVDVARALQRTTPEAVVAAHDVGALAWETDAHIVDVAGLGTDRFAVLSWTGAFTGEQVRVALEAREATALFTIADWMAHDPPDGWRPVAYVWWQRGDFPEVGPFVFRARNDEGPARRWAAEVERGLSERGRFEWAEIQKGDGNR